MRKKCSIKEIILHPEFNSLTLENDLALLQLGEPLQFNDNVQPVCFSRSKSNLTSSIICVVTGWDLNGEGEMATKLQQMEVPLETDGICESYYGRIKRSMSCAGPAKGQASFNCRGQPGSPLVCPSNDPTAFFIYGLASRGVGCRGNAKPGLYTKIPLFTEWIQSIIQAESKEMDYYRNEFAQDSPWISTEDQPDQISNSQEPPGALSNGSSSQSIYTECRDVVLLQSPGEVKLVADSRDRPKGFSCQLKVQAPANHFIMLNFKALNTSHRHNSQIAIYEGTSSNKTLKAQLSVDTIPRTINSTGSALLIDVNTSVINAQLHLWLSYTFHSHN